MKYTWKQFNKDIREIIEYVKLISCDSVYGIPRGGLILSVRISYLANIPLLLDEKKITRNTLVVDDISDTGKTLKKFQQKGCPTLTIFYHKQTISKPGFCLREKESEWIIFPWEE